MMQCKRISLFTLFSTVVLAIGLVFAGGTALAAEAADEEYLLEEIVVTAEFREKAIQDTPLAITAVNAEMMEVRNQVTLDQITWQAPNVSLRPGNATYGSALTAYIRGIGQTDFNPSVEPGVGIYVDDVYYSTITGNILDLLDLERVEVLRGPQGTLAGRNALGGAIKLFTRKADGQDDGSISVTYGSFNRLDVNAAAGFTIIPDKLFARVAGVSRSRDGYVTSYDYACRNGLSSPGTPGGFPTFMTSGSPSNCELADEGGQSMTAGRLSLRWVPSDKFEVNFSANIVNDKSGSQPSVLLYARSMVGAGANPIPIFYDNNGDGVYTPLIDIPYDSRFETGGTFYNYATYIDDGKSTPSPFFHFFFPGQNVALYKPHVVPRINHLDARDYTLNLDWDITDTVALKSITSYREYTNTFGDDNDGSPFSVQQLLQRMDHDQLTQELRLNAKLFDDFADTTLGVFYLDQETIEDARVNIMYVGFDFIHGPDKVPSESKAAYGQASLHLTDRSDLTLGARYSKDKKSYTFQRHNADGTLIDPFDPTILFDLSNLVPTIPPGVVFIPFPFDANQPGNVLLQSTHGQSVSYSSNRFDYRVALDYDINNDVMVFGQIATGYRAGGNNARPFYPSQINAFEPEVLTNYEIGVKSTLFDQLRLNASVFYNDYTDIQLNVNNCYWAPHPVGGVDERSPCASQENVGDAEVKGFELEGMWYPTRALTLDFSYSYLDFKYTSILEYEGAPVSNAKTTPYTPENKWSVGAQYRFDLAKHGDLTWRIDAAYQDDVETTGMVGQGVVIDAYTLFNGRLTWRSADLKWQVSLEGTNLTDKYYYLTVFDLVDGLGSIFKNAQPGRPREIGLTIKRSWY